MIDYLSLQHGRERREAMILLISRAPFEVFSSLVLYGDAFLDGSRVCEPVFFLN